MDKTYVKVIGERKIFYRVVFSERNIIGFLLPSERYNEAAFRLFKKAIKTIF